MSEPYKIAIVTVVDGGGHLLMIRRVGDDSSNGGKWEFPAGHIDGGERPEIAAVREVLEETGLDIYLMPWKIDLPTKAGKAAQFLGFVTKGDIKPEPDLAEDEHDRYVWIKARDLSKVKPTHKNMSEHLVRLLRKTLIGLKGEQLERSASRRESAETGQSFSGKLYRGVEPDPAKARRDRIPSQFAVGEHWTDNPEIAETYGSEVISRHITLNNPYVITLGEKAYFMELRKEFGTNRPDEITKKLLSEGHDGLIVKNVPIQRMKPDGEYVVMRDSTEYILFKRRTSHRRQAKQLLPTRLVRGLPEPAEDLREAILVGDEVEIFLKNQAYRGEDSAPDISGIVDRRNRNTLWIRPLEENEEPTNQLKNPFTWKNDGGWAFIRVYRDPDHVIHYVKGNPYDPDGKTVERAKGIGLILETNPPDYFESVFALMRNETPDLDRSMGQAPESFDEVAPFNKPRPGIPPILHRVREVLRDSGLEPDLVDHVGNGRVLILTQDSDLKKDIVRVLQKGGVEVTAGRRGDLIATGGRRRLATGVGGTTTIPIETDDELMRSTVVQRQQKLKRERERKAADVVGQGATGPAVTNPSQAFTPNPSITLENPMTQVKGLEKYGQTEVLPGNQGIKMTFAGDTEMQKFQNDMKNNPMFKFTQTASRTEKRQAARGFIQGFRRAMRQGDYGSAREFLTRLVGMGIREESIVKSRLAGRTEWAALNHYATGMGEIRIVRLSRQACRLAPDL
jgi:8-oxo-dGTP diphosphatase